MPPTSDGVRTVGCRLEKLVPDPSHLRHIRIAVDRVHRVTCYATELLNLHVRRCLRDGLPLDNIFTQNWLVKAFYEVTDGATFQPDLELSRTNADLMPPHPRIRRNGLKQLFMANCVMLEATAKTNVHVHFFRRLTAHARRLTPQNDATTNARHRIEVARVVSDICAPPGTPQRSEHTDLVATIRSRLHIDQAVGDWEKPLAYHLKASPHRFLWAMYVMSADAEAAGHGGFALFPLRRALVPRHVRFDKTSLHDVLTSLRNEENGVRKRRREDAEADLTFDAVLDYHRAGIQQRHRIKHGFTTDGVCARVQHVVHKDAAPKTLRTVPRRGVWLIDQLKAVARSEDLHVVGIDPGKAELIVGVDRNEPRRCAVRYTQKQRAFDLQTRRTLDEARRHRPLDVQLHEEELSHFSSYASTVEGFQAFCTQRHERLEAAFDYYAELRLRARRWKTSIRSQASEERMYRRIREVQKKDPRPLVLAYGAWGLVAGRPGVACNRGNPPCVGAGLMKRLSRRFLVSPTPEHHTSKTCAKCLGPCGAHPSLHHRRRVRANGERTWRDVSIRGLRLCQQEDCKFLQNRDRAAAGLIGLQFERLLDGGAPLRMLSSEEAELHHSNLLCAACD